jgi:hypothetical protein
VGGQPLWCFRPDSIGPTQLQCGSNQAAITQPTTFTARFYPFHGQVSPFVATLGVSFDQEWLASLSTGESASGTVTFYEVEQGSGTTPAKYQTLYPIPVPEIHNNNACGSIGFQVGAPCQFHCSVGWLWR